MNGIAWMRFSALVMLLGKTVKQRDVDPKPNRDTKSNEIQNRSFPALLFQN
jgi:hypothetical protein